MDIKAQLKQIQDKVLYRELQPIQSVENNIFISMTNLILILLRTIISV